jgi:biotin carboxyl carrier protein
MKLSINYEKNDIDIFYTKSRNEIFEMHINGESLSSKIEYIGEDEIDVSINGKKIFATITMGNDSISKILINGQEFQMSRNDLVVEKSELLENEFQQDLTIIDRLFSPIPGKIFKINVKEGDIVKKGDIVIVVDAMKMENNLVAKKDSIVKKIHVETNQMVTGNYLLVELDGLKN